MAKSNYPSKLDTSKEIPAIRDNILDIGSDSINSLREAIFNIERTLGINPQGVVGNTVANRLNAISDGSGNIKKDALTIANVLSGPIIDSDVANTAAIKESKLRLDFPTKVLQDEVSILNNELSVLIAQIEALSTIITAHTNAYAINRHNAEAISVAPVDHTASDSSLSDLDSTSVQEALEAIHDRHINYTGASISLLNNSHLANQIYFDDSSLTVIDADNVQTAIEEIANLNNTLMISHQDTLHSNGYLRNGYIVDSENEELGLILISNSAVTFLASNGESDFTTNIQLSTPVQLNGFGLAPGDLVVIEDDADTESLYTGTFEILKINKSIDELKVESLDICGFLHGNSTDNTTITIAKNPRRTQNFSGLLLSTREQATLTSAELIQIANPDAVTIVSSGVVPSEITSTNRYFNLSIDGDADIQIDLYDSSSTHQSVDSIVKVINEQVAENNYSFLAYRVDQNNLKTEFAIVYNLPDTESEKHTITVSTGGDSGIIAAGFSNIDGIVISAEVNSLYYINGNKIRGLKKKLGLTGLSYFASEIIVTVGNTDTNFINSNIKVGDLLIISNAENTADNGSFIISVVSADSISLSSDQLPTGFTGAAADSTEFTIYENIINLESIVFDEVSDSLGAAIVECYIDSNQNLFWKKRIEYLAELSGSDPLVTVVNYTDNFADSDQYVLRFQNIDSVPYVSFDDGALRRISGANYYGWVYSSTTTRGVEVYIPDASSLQSYIALNGTLDIIVYGFNGLNTESVLMLGKVPFGNFNGRVIGGENNDSPRIFNSKYKGTIGYGDLRDDAIKKCVEEPIDDLRTNGVIWGTELISCTISSGIYNIVVGSGIVYVNGRRIDINKDTISTNIDSTSVDKFYVGISSDGDIVFLPSEPISCDNPFAGTDTITIGTVEYDGVSVRVIDLRLFISDIDLKILNSITVSPDGRLGHFSSVPKAIKYAKRFSDLYPNAGVPTVHLKSGIHDVVVEIDESGLTFANWLIAFLLSPSATLDTLYSSIYNDGIFIDFPINLTGEGDSSVLKIRSKYTFADQVISFRGIVLIPGDGFTTITAPNDVFNSGFIKISDLKIDNARISLIDMNVETGATINTFGIDIDSIIFDMENFTSNGLDSLIGKKCIVLAELDDTAEYKGNLRINNCKFLDGFISIDSVDRVRNLRISNNIVYGNESGKIVDKDIVTFAGVADGANIEIIGNYISNNTNALSSVDAPLFTTGIKMAARMESDLFLAGDLTSNSDINANNYKYNATKIIYKTLHVDQITDVDMGSSTSGRMAFDTYDNGTRIIKVINDYGFINRYCTIRLPQIPKGARLTEITVKFYVETPSAPYYGYTLNLYEEDASLSQTLLATSAGVSPLALGALKTHTFGGLSEEADTYSFFYIRLTKTPSAGALQQYITHINYSIEVDDIEAMGGVN